MAIFKGSRVLEICLLPQLAGAFPSKIRTRLADFGPRSYDRGSSVYVSGWTFHRADAGCENSAVMRTKDNKHRTSFPYRLGGTGRSRGRNMRLSVEAAVVYLKSERFLGISTSS